MIEIKLLKGREIPVKAGHPWIFSKGIQDIEKLKNSISELGTLVKIFSHNNEPLGIGTCNPKNSICVRVLSQNAEEKIDENFFKNRLTELNAQKKEFLPPKTNGYRVVHSDADYMPGLIIDIYKDTVVFQVTTAGMEKLKPLIVPAIEKTLKPKIIVERSDVESRRQEGLKVLGTIVHKGEIKGPIEFQENGIKFLVDVFSGQKTGFFLDQRSARAQTRALSKDKKVLNLFGYTGAFSVYAFEGGAKEVMTVDSSKQALEFAKQNIALNDIDKSKATFLEGDIFDLLNSDKFKKEAPDLIVCDPPALAKTVSQIDQALQSYTFLNRKCLEILPKGGILVTSSCSGRITLEEFKSALKIAAGYAKKSTRILDIVHQPFDHTTKLSFPEGGYLKTLILEVL